jgi:hypothetical protein
MKKQQILAAVCAGLISLGLVGSADAALVSRLGGLAYYDDNADLTWLADANANSYMAWGDANTWAAALDVGGVGGWRLPDTLQPDASCSFQSGGISMSLNCTGSEMGNLFYNVLGGVAETSITTTHNTNYDLFSNVQSSYYWSATEYAPITDNAWAFSMDFGSQNYRYKTDNGYAWAVQSGDVSAVPVPAAVWLFASGLMGLAGFARRKR